MKRWTNEATRGFRSVRNRQTDAFDEATSNLDEYSDTVTFYINFHKDTCVPTRTHMKYDDKPCFNTKLKQLHRPRRWHTDGDQVLGNMVRTTLNKEIRTAKKNHLLLFITDNNERRQKKNCSFFISKFFKLIGLVYILGCTELLVFTFAYTALHLSPFTDCFVSFKLFTFFFVACLGLYFLLYIIYEIYKIFNCRYKTFHYYGISGHKLHVILSLIAFKLMFH